MATFIYPYTTASESAKALAEAMGVKRMLREGSTVENTKNNKIINWGSTDLNTRKWNDTWIINDPAFVAFATNKTTTFRALQQAKVNIPQFTLLRDQALTWLREGYQVVARATVTGHNSAGLTIHRDGHNLPAVPLYTRYIPKDAEYRIHVIDGNVVIVQKKVWPSTRSSAGVDFRIRDSRQGFVFQTTKVSDLPSKMIIHQAIEAVDALKLDFGGVDVIWVEADKMAYVLEVNTAPGIEGTDLTSYSTALKTLTERLK